MTKTKEPLPKILTANDLLQGGTVYYTASGEWSPHVTSALVATSPEAVEALNTAGAEAFATNVVIEVAVVDVNANGALRPARLREVIRATGPTVYRYLNKSVSPEK